MNLLNIMPFVPVIFTAPEGRILASHEIIRYLISTAANSLIKLIITSVKE